MSLDGEPSRAPKSIPSLTPRAVRPTLRAPTRNAPRRPQAPAAQDLSDADRQALELVERVEAHIDVARSLLRITVGRLHVHASQASLLARAITAEVAVAGEDRLRAQLGRFQKIARAAAGAAIDAKAAADARMRDRMRPEADDSTEAEGSSGRAHASDDASSEDIEDTESDREEERAPARRSPRSVGATSARRR